MKLSVLITFYNQEKYVDATLEVYFHRNVTGILRCWSERMVLQTIP